MPHKDPATYSILTYIWVIGLSAMGGIAHYINKLNSGLSRFNLVEIFGEIFVSGFAGLMTFYLCEAAEIEYPLTAVLIGVSGHMGSRTIFILENIFNKTNVD